MRIASRNVVLLGGRRSSQFPRWQRAALGAVEPQRARSKPSCNPMTCRRSIGSSFASC